MGNETSTKIFSFPDAGAAANNSLAAMLPALLQNRGIDATALMGMMANANGGLFGGRGLDDLIALIIVAGLFGNGNGFGFGGNNGRGDTERQMLMDAIQRNGVGRKCRIPPRMPFSMYLARRSVWISESLLFS